MGFKICRLSFVPAVLGLFKFAFDIYALVALHIVAREAPKACEIKSNNFFKGCFYLQLAVLLVGQIYHSLSAAIENWYHNESAPRSFALALLGALNLEVAWIEGSPQPPTPTDTARVLNIRLAEMVTEAPQLVVTLVTLLARDSCSEAASGALESATTGQLVFIIAGLAMLCMSATQVLFLHPQSFWSSSIIPEKLPLGLLPLSGLWQLLLFGSSIWSLGGSLVLYTHISLLWTSMQRQADVSAASAVASLLVPMCAAYVFNALLLVLLQNKTCSQAACMGLVSVFLNVPWIKNQPGDSWQTKHRNPWQALLWSVAILGTVIGIGFTLTMTLLPGRDTTLPMAGVFYTWGIMQAVNFCLACAHIDFMRDAYYRTRSCPGAPPSSSHVLILDQCEMRGIAVSIPAAQWDFSFKDMCSHLVQPFE
jgi:hypothetical protein